MSPPPGTNLREEAAQLALVVILMDVGEEAREGFALPVPVGGAGLARNGSFERTASDLSTAETVMGDQSGRRAIRYWRKMSES